MVKRRRGEKLPKNYVKIAILLYVGDERKSSLEIREYLKDVHSVSERKGIQLHLSKLCEEGYLEGETKAGIAAYYQWKKSTESFKKIIELISENADMVRKIILEKSKVIPPKTITEKFQIKKLFETYNVDPTQFWYNTKYAKSFFTEDVLNDLLDKSYDDYSTNKGTYPLNKSEFRIVVLENTNTQAIITLMHYSPNLVKYIIDLPNLYQKKTRNLKEKENRIFYTVLDDIIHGNYSYHGSGGYIREPTIDKIDSNAFKGVKLEFDCSLVDPGTSPIKDWKGGKII